MFQVDEVVHLRRFRLQTLPVVVQVVRRDERSPGRVGTDLHRRVVFLFQIRANFAEFRKRRPARTDVASSRHAVAFALMSHQLVNGLKNKRTVFSLHNSQFSSLGSNYLATDSVVVQVHQSSGIPHFPLSGVDELPGEIAAVADIG